MTRKVTLLVAVVVALASLSGVAVAADPTFTPGSAGIGDPYYPLDGNGGYDVQHYLLDVKYDPATNRLAGVATITAQATQDLSAFNLDFVRLRVRSIDVNGQPASWSRQAGEMTVTPAAGIVNGSIFTAVIRYDGSPKTLDEFGASGFFHTDDGALVVGEPHVAATWFPANDHPSDKAAITFRITVPTGLQAIANGELISMETTSRWDTWTWDAKAPMATYLAGMGIGHFDIRSYQEAGIKYWDAIDTTLMEDTAPPITPADGEQFLYSQVGDLSYKRLTRTIDVPPGGAQLSFQVNRDTEFGWDFLFVESRTAEGSDWTTLPDENNHTSQDPGACPGFLEANPFLEHYLTPDFDTFQCDVVGTTGEWHATSGMSDGWEDWLINLDNDGAETKAVEVSITYASDEIIQERGVAIDDVVVSTGEGTTSFEDDGDTLDGWVAPLERPDGGTPNPNTWVAATSVAGIPGPGGGALESFDRQPEIIAFLSDNFGRYPFSASGGIVDAADLAFALENQTRPIYSQAFFFGGQSNDGVVVHELAHQWYGDSLALERWQHIWLNEGFATYAEWMWSEHEGSFTPQDIYEFFSEEPADSPFWSLAIGDPGPDSLFDFPVYFRGGLTLQALRNEVGDRAFFRILRQWARTQAGGNVTTDEFIALAEQISGQELDPLFDAWLYSPTKPDFGLTTSDQFARAGGASFGDVPDVVRNQAERLGNRAGNPFGDAE